LFCFSLEQSIQKDHDSNNKKGGNGETTNKCDESRQLIKERGREGKGQARKEREQEKEKEGRGVSLDNSDGLI
jgi:hypothetical protein